jgi:hypothetical protein
MTDIVYNRTFTHTDWLDGESIVQASGPDGFNIRFHGCEQEFDAISNTFGAVNTALKNVQKMSFVQSQPPLTLPANGASAEFQIEQYDPSTLSPNVQKVYFAVVFPASGSTNIQHTFLYRNAPGGKINVTVQFFNHDTAQPAQFSFRVLTLAAQS